jgi:hypothetical protein
MNYSDKLWLILALFSKGKPIFTLAWKPNRGLEFQASWIFCDGLISPSIHILNSIVVFNLCISYILYLGWFILNQIVFEEIM